MKLVEFHATDVAGAKEEILRLIQRNLINSNNVMYFHGWFGFGARTVLRSIAQALPSMKDPPPELCFDIILYIDCSKWISKRAMQKKIAKELKLDHKIMAMFDEQDEEDDFNGVDYGSRELVRSVSAAIHQFLKERSFMMIFINGSDDEIPLGKFGIRESNDCVIIWTFSRCDILTWNQRSDHIIEKLKGYTDLYIELSSLSPSGFLALFHEMAATIVASYTSLQGIDLTIVVHCFLYGILLYHGVCSTTGSFWLSHSPNYWICDGIIQGDRAWEISNALQHEFRIQCDDSILPAMLGCFEGDLRTPPFLRNYGDVYKKRPCRWFFPVALKNKNTHEDMISILAGASSISLAGASSIFLGFETKDSPRGLPNNFFEYCNQLGVLVIHCCSFSFVAPPFLHCHTLRFLGLDNCTDNNNSNAVENQGGACATRWACLQSLCVIDLYYTDWVELLSEEKMEFMANLTELNMEGVRCSHLLRCWLQDRQPHLQRLRIIKPMYDEANETMSSDISGSFLMDNTRSLEILDLSGNDRGMRKLPASMSEARHLQVLILDGCDGLEEVVLSGNTSLRSFSLDGYGPAASHRTSTIDLPPVLSRPEHPLDTEKKSVVKTSKLSLAGCTRLDNLFLRGLPNLEELDLSGCTMIKVLDFGAMVVDVPKLKRLFLLGCENLRAIKWGSYYVQQPKLLELICIDTRPSVGCARPLSLCAQQKSFQLQVHAILADARLARSLWAPIYSARAPSDARYFNISITSSATCTETIQPEVATNKEKVTGSIDHQRRYDIATRDMYRDIFTKAGDGLAPTMQAFPKGPTGQLDRHIEIGDGSRSVQSEVEADPSGDNLAGLMGLYTESLHVHDVSTCTNTMPTGRYWNSLRWCRVERCPKLHAVFPPGAEDVHGKLETIWASDLRMARCVWSKGIYSHANRFKGLRHLHLRCCPSLQFGLAMGRRPSFPSLETIHIIHCGELRHIFVPCDEEYQHTSVEFPKLTIIHLHDLPALQQICEAAAEMLAPALETIKIRGCWSLRRLPAMKGRETGKGRPAVEMEKDVWDALEWDGVDAGHHPSLYETPVHSRYYKRRIVRTTVLR